MKKRLLYLGMVFALGLGTVAVPRENVQAAGTIALTTMGTVYTQDFNTLAKTGTINSIGVLSGWYLTESGNNSRVNELYGTDDGGSSTGDTYSYGVDDSPERALGGLRSTSFVTLFGANFTNDTGSAITALEVAYTGEEWRLGTGGRSDQLAFEYSNDATSLITGTWTGISALDFITPDTVTTGAKDGNAAGKHTELSAQISGLNIPNGTTFWIRWSDVDASGADDGLAIDDFSLTPRQATATIDTTVSLITDPNPSLLGEWVTLTATVSAIPPEAGIPTGFMQFFDNGEPYGEPAELAEDGMVVSMTQFLSVGDHHLTATYLGNNNFNSSTSPEVVQTVEMGPATISFTRQTPTDSFTNFDSLVFQVTFSKAVIGVDAADFAVNSIATATVANVNQVNSSTYDVTVSGGDLPDFNGTLGLNFSNTMSITDRNDHGLPNSEPPNDEEYTVDNSAPDTQIDTHPADPSSREGVSFTFSSTDPTASLECQLDSGGFSTCTSPKEYTGLLDGSHTFEVRAMDMANNVDPTPATYVWTIHVAPPDAFSKIAPADGVNSIPHTAAVLSWASSTGATSYEYCIDMINDGWCNTSWVSTNAETFVTLSNLSTDTTYYWQIRTRNSAGIVYADSSVNAYWSFTTQGKPATFGKTTPLSGVSSQPTNPTLRWAVSAGASSYEYCIDTINDGWCNTSWISTNTQTSITLNNLSTNTRYYWQARARNSIGITPADNSTNAYWSFTTLGAPSAFGKAIPISGVTNQPANSTLNWGISAEAASYEYCLDTINDGWCNTSWISTNTQTSAALNGLSPNTTYYWQVRARNSAGITFADNSVNGYWSFTTQGKPAAFGKITPLSDATGQATNPTLSWEASVGADSYEYCIDTIDDGWCNTSWVSTSAQTSATLNNLSANTTYYWQVRARNGVGVTAADSSTSWSFTTQ